MRFYFIHKFFSRNFISTGRKDNTTLKIHFKQCAHFYLNYSISIDIRIPSIVSYNYFIWKSRRKWYVTGAKKLRFREHNKRCLSFERIFYMHYFSVHASDSARNRSAIFSWQNKYPLFISVGIGQNLSEAINKLHYVHTSIRAYISRDAQKWVETGFSDLFFSIFKARGNQSITSSL